MDAGLTAEGALVQCSKRGVAAFSVDRNGYHVHRGAISAWVRAQCGAPLFEAREVDRIQQALAALDRGSQRLFATS